MKRIIYIFTFFLTFAMNANAAKEVFYIHGTFAEYTPVKIHMLNVYQKLYTPSNGELCWYDSRNSISDLGTFCYNKYVQPKQVNKDVILVAHSMGGSVARTMLDKSSNIKGLITAGTANNGSLFFTKLSDGTVWGFIQDMYNRGSNAVTVSKVNIANALLPGSSFAASVTNRVGNYNAKKDITMGFLKLGFDKIAVPFFNSYYPCLPEMSENSGFNNGLNSKKINVPYINIYGAEDSWPFVRAISSQKLYEDVRNESPSNLDKTYDDKGVTLLNDGLSVVNFVQDAHNVLYDVMSVVSIFVWKYRSSRELVKQARYNWDDLYRYIQTDVHNEIAKYNGAYQYEKRTYTYRIFGKTYTSTSYLPVIRENDGMNPDKAVILPESMAGTGGKIWNERALHVNHQEMGNHIEMRKIFDNAFKYNKYDPIFNLQ